MVLPRVMYCIPSQLSQPYAAAHGGNANIVSFIHKYRYAVTMIQVLWCHSVEQLGGIMHKNLRYCYKAESSKRFLHLEHLSLSFNFTFPIFIIFNLLDLKMWLWRFKFSLKCSQQVLIVNNKRHCCYSGNSKCFRNSGLGVRDKHQVCIFILSYSSKFIFNQLFFSYCTCEHE